jgi:hypothetical protein
MLGLIAVILLLTVVAGAAGLVKSREVRSVTADKPEPEPGNQENDAAR